MTKMNSNSRFPRRYRRALKALCPIAFVVGALAMTAATRSPKTEIARNLEIFNTLYKELQLNYVDSIDAEKTMKTAIRAMLSEIDPYTEYFPADEQEAFKVISTGEYGGIGSIIMQKSDGGVYISEPYENSPAHKAGLRAGDRILAVDNDTVGKDWTTAMVSDRLKGQAGTMLKVTVARPYETDSILTFEFMREKIQMPSVPYYGMVDDETGYIALTSFTEKAPQEVRDALLDLKNNMGARTLILDLQGNGGGLLESAVKIVGLFVPKNTEVLRTRGKGALTEKVYKTTSSPIAPDMPLAVLIDGGSASSSEIVTGAMQDLDRAVIVGARSFGKGLVQSTRPLPYDGMLKVTIAKYYIPSGRLIQEIDYSHRNPDGTAARKPDSLCTVFYTAHGREVRDGGGITPDVESAFPPANRLTYNIVRDNWAFDYATRYAALHKQRPASAVFEITDSIFDDFKSTIDPERFKYDKVCETMLANMRKAVEAEGYMNDSVDVRLKELEGMLRHNLNHDLDHSRRQIEEILSDEITKRYYHQRGAVENRLRFDAAVDSAKAILGNPGRYRSILTTTKKK